MLLLWADNLERSWFPFWIEFKASAMEVDRCPVMVSIPIGAGVALHLLNLAVESFPQGIGYPKASICHDIVDGRFQVLCGLDHLAESRVSGPKIPPREVFPHPYFSVWVVTTAFFKLP